MERLWKICFVNFVAIRKLGKLAGKIIGGMIGSYMNPQLDNRGEENALIEDDDMAEAENDALVQAFLEKLMEKDSEMKAAIESLPEEARSQFLFSVGLPSSGRTPSQQRISLIYLTMFMN